MVSSKQSRRFRLLTLALAAAVAVALTGCGGGGSKGDTGAKKGGSLGGDVAKGKEVYANTCASCHGVDAKGMPGLGKDWTTSEFIAGMSDQEMLDFIKKGRPATDPANTTGVDMPPKGGNPALQDQDLINVIAFMRSVNTNVKKK